MVSWKIAYGKVFDNNGFPTRDNVSVTLAIDTILVYNVKRLCTVSAHFSLAERFSLLHHFLRTFKKIDVLCFGLATKQSLMLHKCSCRHRPFFFSLNDLNINRVVAEDVIWTRLVSAKAQTRHVTMYRCFTGQMAIFVQTPTQLTIFRVMNFLKSLLKPPQLLLSSILEAYSRGPSRQLQLLDGVLCCLLNWRGYDYWDIYEALSVSWRMRGILPISLSLPWSQSSC